MNKILIISNFYYPLQHIASNRIVAFGKYLNEFGYDTVVITKGDKDENKVIDGVRVYYVKDDSIIKKADTSKIESKLIHYFKCVWNIFIMNFVIDEDFGWTKCAEKKAVEVLKEESFDFVLSSAPPIGSHIIAYSIKKKFTKIKWIVDMRDALWSPNYPRPMRQKLIKFIKNIIALQGDILLAVSKPQLEEYKKITNNKMYYLELRNGYDFDFIESNKDKTKKYRIIYAGNFYSSRKPDKFFQAVQMLLVNNEIEDFCIEIVGNSAPITIPKGLSQYVNIYSRMDYKKLIKYLRENADLLLMINPSSIEKGCYTGKLFDYIGIGKPILGLVPKNDVAADLIKKTNIGYVADDENIDEIKFVLKQAYEDWKIGRVNLLNYTLIKKHHRKEQVERLVKFIRNIYRNA